MLLLVLFGIPNMNGCMVCMVLVHLQPVVIFIVCHAIAIDGGVGGVLDHGLCLDRSVALTLEGLIRPHSTVATSHGGWVWLQISLCD